MRTTTRRLGALALGGLLGVVLIAAPAQAAAYRYWSYWQAAPGATAWSFATQGPATAIPADGAVEGWRFGLAESATVGDDAPASPPDFDAVCAETAPADGMKRVALVIDAGEAQIAPVGQTPPALAVACVLAEPEATGFDVLTSVVGVRTERGLICALAGYPEAECAPVLDEAAVAALTAATGSAPAATAPATAPAAPETGSPIATLAVATLLFAAAGVGIVAARRRGRPGGQSHG